MPLNDVPAIYQHRDNANEDLGAQAEGVWAKLETDCEVVIMRDGKPFALLVHTDQEGLEENLRVFRAARFARTLAEMRGDAQARGLDRLTAEEIDAEIAEYRREQQTGDASRR